MSDTETGAAHLPATTPASAGIVANPDLVHSVTLVDRAIKDRRDSDTQLINWWLYILLVSPITIGFYGLYLFYKRISRIDAFSRRKQAYYEALLEWTEREAESLGRDGEVHDDVVDLGSRVYLAYRKDLRPINAGLSILLTFITIGFYGLFVLYRQNRYWWDAQVLEEDFDDKLSHIWMRLGIIKYPVNFRVDQSKRRSYALYLILSLVSFGIWCLVWDYKIHTDPDNLYGEFHSIEDTVLQTVRSH